MKTLSVLALSAMLFMGASSLSAWWYGPGYYYGGYGGYGGCSTCGYYDYGCPTCGGYYGGYYY